MKLSLRHYGIIISGLITAYLHISLYPDFGYFDWVVLNGFGTIALLAAYFLPIPFFQQRHDIIFWAMLAYIWLTISLWVLFGDKTFQFETTAATGYYAKTAEFIMLAFMWAELSDASHAASPGEG